ncbi:MAG TPA: signal recognition particle protein, partial [Candidatus Avimonas sp.]|nr:signal recognition particle protein [Candidatus Avimonas sp.]
QENKFDFNDMLEQFRQINKMGDLKGILSMIPGIGSQLKDVEIDERQIARVEAIILSMTPAERANPDIINPSRKRRIAAGCGMKVEDVNRLIKQLEQMRKMMKQMKNFGKKGMRGMPRMPFMPPLGRRGF